MTEQSSELRKQLDALASFIAELQRSDTATVLAALPELEKFYRLIEYECRYGVKRAVWSPEVESSGASISARRCEVQGCQSGATLYNIAAGQRSEDWRCLEHIPAGLTFPIALWGEDWEKSGRKKQKGMLER